MKLLRAWHAANRGQNGTARVHQTRGDAPNRTKTGLRGAAADNAAIPSGNDRGLFTINDSTINDVRSTINKRRLATTGDLTANAPGRGIAAGSIPNKVLVKLCYFLVMMNTSKSGPVRGERDDPIPMGAGGVTPFIGMLILPPNVPLVTGEPKKFCALRTSY